MANIKADKREKAHDEYLKAVDSSFEAYSISKNSISVCEVIFMGVEQGRL